MQDPTDKTLDVDLDPITASSDPTQDLDVGDYVADAGMGVARGVVGFGQSIYDLLDFATGDDLLSDVDLKDLTGVGKAKTMVGGLTEGVTQFALGFFPAGAVIRGASVAGKLGKASKLLLKKNQLGKAQLNVGGDVVAGVTSDFISFSGQEERLSNLLVQYPELKNPVTEYLAYTEGDSEIEGRMKNVLEGLMLEVGVGIPIAHLFMKSLDVMKKGSKDVPLDGADEAIAKTQAEIKEGVSEVTAEGKVVAEGLEVKPLAEVEPEIVQPKVEPKKSDADADSTARTEEPVVEETSLAKGTDDPEIKKTPIGMDLNKAKEYAESVASNYNVGSGGRVAPIVAETAGDADELFKITAKALSDHAEKAKPKTEAEQLAEAKKLADDLGYSPEDIKSLNQLVELLNSSEEGVKQAIIHRNAANILVRDISHNVKSTLDKIWNVKDIDSEDFRVLQDQFNSHMNSYRTFSAIRSRLNSQFGRALGGATNFTGLDKASKLNYDPSKETPSSLDIFRGDKSTNLSKEEIKQMAEVMRDHQDYLLEFPDKMDELLKSLSSKPFTGVNFNTVWRNSILSGVKTVSTAISSSTLNSVVRISQLGMGGVLTGNTQVAKAILTEGFRHMQNFSLLSNYKDTLRTGVSAFEGNPFRSSVGEHGTIDRYFTGQGIIPYLYHNVIRFPEKNLSAIDSVMKTAAFNLNARVDLAQKGIDKGLTGKQLTDFVDRGMEKITLQNGVINNPVNIRREKIKEWKKDGTFDELSYDQKLAHLSGLEADAVKQREVFDRMTNDQSDDFLARHQHEADMVTFTETLGEGKLAQMSSGLGQIPYSEWVVPFRRTPINVIKQPISLLVSPIKAGADYGKNVLAKGSFTNLENARSQILRDLASDDPMVKSRAAGKLAMGVSAQYAIFSVVNGSHENITGSGSPDPAVRKRMEDAGWQPYSVKIGDKYYSYKRLDPLASIIGLAADWRDASTDPSTIGNGFMETAQTASLTAISGLVYDKSFLTSVNAFVDAMGDEKKFVKLIQNYAVTAVPTIVPQAREIITGDPMAVETWSLMDKYQKRIGFSAGTLDPKRNILGEEVDVQELAGVMDRGFDIVANVSESKDDIVLEEIAMLRGGFNIPNKLIAGGIDLTQYEGADGRTAYDFYRKSHGEVRIGGVKLRQALTRVIKSRWYQKLDARSAPDFQSQRIAELQKVIRRYRTEALKATLREFKDVNTLYTTAQGIKQRTRQGYNTFDQVEELLNLY